VRHRNASGDGCGGVGYCKGLWVLKSTRHHRHGEPIGGDPWEPADALCEGFWWVGGEVSGTVCGVYGSIRYFTHHH
jgi:hypothetical protein